MTLISGSAFRYEGIPIPEEITSGSEFTVTLLEGPGYLTLESKRDNDGFYTSSGNFASISGSNLTSTVYGEHIVSGVMGGTISGSLSFVASKDIPANDIRIKIATPVSNPKVDIYPTLLLDEYPNASVAYSLRELSTAFVGQPVVRVRRSSNNDKRDFNATEVIDGTLESWVGGFSNGFVERLYDQSGNLNDAVQLDPNYQPAIVSLGLLVKVNNKPSISFVDSYFRVENDITGEDFGVYSVFKPDSVDPFEDGWIIDNFTSFGRGLVHDDYLTGRVTLITDTTTTTPIRVRSNITTDLTLITGIIDNNSPLGGTVEIFRNGTSEDLFEGDVPYQENTFPQYIGAGTGTASESFRGNISEIIIYTSTNLVRLDRPKIDNNIIDYYNI